MALSCPSERSNGSGTPGSRGMRPIRGGTHVTEACVTEGRKVIEESGSYDLSERQLEIEDIFRILRENIISQILASASAELPCIRFSLLEEYKCRWEYSATGSNLQLSIWATQPCRNFGHGSDSPRNPGIPLKLGRPVVD